MPGLQQQGAAVVVGLREVCGGLREIGLEREGLAIAGDGFIDATEIAQGIAAVVVGIREVGIERQRTIETLDGRCGFSAAVENTPQIAVVGGRVRIERDCLADQIGRQRPFATLVMNHAQIVQGIGVMGLNGKDVAVNRLGDLCPPLTMMVDGGLQPLRDPCVIGFG